MSDGTVTLVMVVTIDMSDGDWPGMFEFANDLKEKAEEQGTVEKMAVEGLPSKVDLS